MCRFTGKKAVSSVLSNEKNSKEGDLFIFQLLIFNNDSRHPRENEDLEALSLLAARVIEGKEILHYIQNDKKILT